MSSSYWVCQGIGVEQSTIVPYLDGDKLVKLINDDELEENYAFSTLSNKEKVKVLMDVHVCEEAYELVGLLAAQNEEQYLIAGTDGCGSYFLLYPPSYPWENSGGFKSQEEVVRYIYDLVRPYCRDDVSEEDILSIIDTDIYAVGCG